MAVTISTLQKMKSEGKKFAVLTAYDATFSHLISSAEIEVMLVGDSLGMVLQGQDSTVPVTLEEMAYHTAAVKQGNQGSLIIADLPFMSYATIEQAYASSAAVMQAGAQMVKLEGQTWMAETVEQLSERGIPVCAHLGLTPQSVHKFGGFKVQGRGEAADKLLQDCVLMEQAGADLLLLECVPSPVAKAITEKVNIPVIGIGAGPDTDGQVLVMHDMLGITVGRTPRFVKNFLTNGRSIQEAFKAFGEEVRDGTFPQPEHGFES